MSNSNDINNAQVAAGATQILADPYQFDQNGNPTGFIFSNNNQAAQLWRHRPLHAPVLAPQNDSTIPTVRANQENYIAQMMQAVYNQNGVLDDADFRGKKLFTRGSPDAYPAPDIEAACRCLFEQVMDQCHNGYRGKELRPLVSPEDHALTCARRMDEVIVALRNWKCICKEIYLEEKKMAALAYGPIRVSDSKVTNKRNNLQKKVTAAKGVEALKDVEKLRSSTKIPGEDNNETNNGKGDGSNVLAQTAHTATSNASTAAPVLARRRRAAGAPTVAPTRTRQSRAPVPASSSSAPGTAQQSDAPVPSQPAPAPAAQHIPAAVRTPFARAPISAQHISAVAPPRDTPAPQGSHVVQQPDRELTEPATAQDPEIITYSRWDASDVPHQSQYRAPRYKSYAGTLDNVPQPPYHQDGHTVDPKQLTYEPQTRTPSEYVPQKYASPSQPAVPADNGSPGVNNSEQQPFNWDWDNFWSKNPDFMKFNFENFELESPQADMDIIVLQEASLLASPSAKGKRKVREDDDELDTPIESPGPKRRKIRGRRHGSMT
ncbi:hypothetical protein P3342_010357 [Pyrenophora teres f. teres]|nr:hypothetical protein P3342_010357 [Pyrenophora teres f. teres]